MWWSPPVHSHKRVAVIIFIITFQQKTFLWNSRFRAHQIFIHCSRCLIYNTHCLLIHFSISNHIYLLRTRDVSFVTRIVPLSSTTFMTGGQSLWQKKRPCCHLTAGTLLRGATRLRYVQKEFSQKQKANISISLEISATNSIHNLRYGIIRFDILLPVTWDKRRCY